MLDYLDRETRACTTAGALRATLIAEGVLRPGTTLLRRINTAGQPVLRIDAVGRVVAAKRIRVGNG